MEPDELDKIFRGVIRNDTCKLTEKEKISKAKIWQQLDFSAEKKPVLFPRWRVAAGILFLLLGSGLWLMFYNLQSQKMEYAQLEAQYQKLTEKLASLEDEVLEKRKNIKGAQSAITRTDNIAYTDTIIEKEFVDRIVSSKDTVWIEKVITGEARIKLVRDTIYMKVPDQSPVRWTHLKKEEATRKDSILKKRPSKVEFIFEKKEMKKPVQEESILLWKTNFAKKQKRKKRKNGIFSIPDNNQ